MLRQRHLQRFGNVASLITSSEIQRATYKNGITCAKILCEQAWPQRLTNGPFKARLFASNTDERFGYEFSSKRSAARDGGRYNAGGSYDEVARSTGWFNDRGARPREAHWS